MHLSSAIVCILFCVSVLTSSTTSMQSNECDTSCIQTLEQPHYNAISPRQPLPGAALHPRFERATLVVVSLAATPILYSIAKAIYDKTSESLLDAWARSPGVNQLVVEAGNLRWEFGCTVQPIPQLFLEEYYWGKRDAMKRGFAPVYAREWFFNRTDRSRLCYAGMRVVNEGGTAVPPTHEDEEQQATGRTIII